MPNWRRVARRPSAVRSPLPAFLSFISVWTRIGEIQTDCDSVCLPFGDAGFADSERLVI